MNTRVPYSDHDSPPDVPAPVTKARPLLDLARWSLPEHLAESLTAYALEGRPTGGFLAAVLANDLSGAVARADATNRPRLPDICGAVYGELPSACWGSYAKVDAWITRGGLNGRTSRVQHSPTLQEPIHASIPTTTDDDDRR